jgi:hypothetical protein
VVDIVSNNDETILVKRLVISKASYFQGSRQEIPIYVVFDDGGDKTRF